MDLDKIRELDKNMCQFCGTGYNLNVHHIVYRSRGLDNTESNLITLCFKCHMKIHNYTLSIVKVLKRLENRKDFRWINALKYWEEKEDVKKAKLKLGEHRFN